MKVAAVRHALHTPRKDGSAYTKCGHLVRPVTKSRGAKPVCYLTRVGERMMAVRPGYGEPTCKQCLQVKP